MGSVQTGSVWSSAKPFAGGVGGRWKKGHVLSFPLFLLNLLKEKSVAPERGRQSHLGHSRGTRTLPLKLGRLPPLEQQGMSWPTGLTPAPAVWHSQHSLPLQHNSLPGCDKDLLIDILTQRCNTQRLLIAEAYLGAFGRVSPPNPSRFQANF